MLTKSLAYEKWLGIKKEHQPPSLYRLLAIDAFECDKEVIANAADSRMGFVRQFQAGENSKLSAEILNELSHARIVLLNPQTKADYDAKLRAGLSSDATSTSEKGIEPKSSNVATPLDIVPAKSIPQARRLESVQSIAENDRAATSVDIESLVAESAPAGSGKRQARARQPTKPPRVALWAAAIIAVGCVAAGLFYWLTGARPALPANATNNLLSDQRPRTAEVDLPRGQQANRSSSAAPASSVEVAVAGSVQNGGKSPAVGMFPKSTPGVANVRPYDEDRLVKDIQEITGLAKTVKTPDQSRSVAERAIVLADRAIVLGKADTAKDVAVLTLAAARSAESLPLARRATVLLIQLQSPLSDALRQNAKKRLEEGTAESPTAASEDSVAGSPSLHTDDNSAKASAVSGTHDAKWGKTEDERRKIFYDLLKAVDDYGMTPEGRKAWKDIQSRNQIDVRVTLGILNEGFGTFSGWDQPDGGGRASARMNRIQWIGERTRSMTEPMLKD
jgi:hypothetical protein